MGRGANAFWENTGGGTREGVSVYVPRRSR